jgi:Xaa-Pro aminopeptidase
MAKDPQRREMILHELEASRLEALVSFSPTEVLLLTGYWPVMGTSLAICTRDGGVCAVIPEDELQLATSTSDAEFFSYKPATLEHLDPVTEALLDPVKNVVSRLELKSGKIGVDLSGGAQGSSYPSVHHFRVSILPLLQKSAPDLTSVSAGPIFERLKAVKSETEIDYPASRLPARGGWLLPGEARHRCGTTRRRGRSRRGKSFRSRGK